MKIGYVHSTYLESRSFLYIKNSSVNFIKSLDVFKFFTHIIFRLFKKTLPIIQNSYSGIAFRKIDVIHLFNGVSFSSKPWVTSFETKLPRAGNVPKFIENIFVNRLAHDSCKKIIALSQNAADIQKVYLERDYPKLSKKILSKLVVIHPHQVVKSKKPEKKIDPEEKLIFTFIGRQFFRKGGREIIDVFEKICSEHSHCELNIVSLLETDKYASSTNRADIKNIKNTLKKCPKNIVHYENLSNKDVMNLLESTHVALLPTHADTYGFSVLEAQACGVPVITTDVRALGEINDNDCGWVIRVAMDNNRNGFTGSKEGRNELRRTIKKGLLMYVMDIIKNSNQISNKAENAFERVRKYHDPEKLGLKIVSIYRESIE